MPNIIGRITPDGDSGTFPVAFAEHLRGGLQVVANNTARDAIPAARRFEGMEVNVLSPAAKFQLIGGITNGDWVEVTLGTTLIGATTEFSIEDPDSPLLFRTLTDRGSSLKASSTDFTPGYKSWRLTRNMEYTHDANGNVLVRIYDDPVHSWTQWQLETEWRDPGSGFIQNEFNLTEDGKRSIGIYTRVGVKILSISTANPAVVTTEADHDILDGTGVYIVMPEGEMAVLTIAANPGNGETFTVGGRTYTFQTTLTNVDGNVKIGASADASIDNAVSAINGSAGAGTTYAAATTAHATVGAVHGVPAGTGTGTKLGVMPLVPGTGSGISTSETLVNGASIWDSATLVDWNVTSATPIANQPFNVDVTGARTFTIPVNVTAGKSWPASFGPWVRDPLRGSGRGVIGFGHPLYVDTRSDLYGLEPAIWALGLVDLHASVEARITNFSTTSKSSARLTLQGLGDTPGSTGNSHDWAVILGIDMVGGLSVATDNFVIRNMNNPFNATAVYFYGDGDNGRVGIFNITPAEALHVTGNIQASGRLITGTSTPASAAATGKAGTITWDASFIYVCTATDTWKRVAIATW